MSLSPRSIKVILFGVGNVGKALVKQIQAGRPYHAARYNLQFEFVALCDSQGHALSRSYLSDQQLDSILTWKQQRSPLSEYREGGRQGSALDVVKQLADDETIVVDCSATDETVSAFITALEKGAAITMANKKPFCTAYDNFAKIFHPRHRARVRYESTVGAGTPYVATLCRLMASNDCPHKIQGALSGTLGYLCSGLQQGRSYSSVVQSAYELGYTEPDPRDDLGGVDVARKALILARTMGWKIEMKDVQIEPLYPSHLAKLSTPEFMAALPSLDAEYDARHAAAAQAGAVLRYVATLQEGRCVVGLAALPIDSPLGRLQGTENLVCYYTNIYHAAPLVIQGAGAGGVVTAQGVVADMVELADVLMNK